MSEVRSARILDAETAVQLPVEFFDVQTNVPLIHQVVVAQLAAARQGTHSTLTRGEVSGGGAKPWRQKGTGRARHGSRRAPQWTGGGVAHGPKPRDYSQRTPKKMIAAALRGALSDRAREDRIHVVNNLVEGETPSTKAALKALAAIADQKVLVVITRDEDVAWMSLRNVPSMLAIAVDQLNSYDVLRADQVVFTAAAFAQFVDGDVVTVAVEAKADKDEAATTKTASKARTPKKTEVVEAAPEAEAEVETEAAVTEEVVAEVVEASDNAADKAVAAVAEVVKKPAAKRTPKPKPVVEAAAEPASETVETAEAAPKKPAVKRTPKPKVTQVVDAAADKASEAVAKAPAKPAAKRTAKPKVDILAEAEAAVAEAVAVAEAEKPAKPAVRRTKKVSEAEATDE